MLLLLPRAGRSGWRVKSRRQTLFCSSVRKPFSGELRAVSSPFKGRGVVWESDLIYNRLYQSNRDVQRFIPVLFADEHPSSIPLPLQGLSHYLIDTEEGYENLCRPLTNHPRLTIPQLGERRALPPKEPQS